MSQTKNIQDQAALVDKLTEARKATDQLKMEMKQMIESFEAQKKKFEVCCPSTCLPAQPRLAVLRARALRSATTRKHHNHCRAVCPSRVGHFYQSRRNIHA